MKAAIFVRGEDVGWQYARCKKYARSKGYEVVTMISKVSEIYDTIKKQDVDVLIVNSPDRITRDRLEYESVQHILRGFGVIIELVN